MGFWIFMLIMDLLIPFTMIGFGKMFLKKIFKNIFPDFSPKNPVTNSASVPPLPPIFAPFFHFKRFSLQEKYYIKMTNDSKLIFRCL